MTVFCNCELVSRRQVHDYKNCHHKNIAHLFMYIYIYIYKLVKQIYYRIPGNVRGM